MIEKKDNIGLIAWGLKLGWQVFFTSDNLDDNDKEIKDTLQDIRSIVNYTYANLVFYSLEFTSNYKVYTIYRTIYDWNNRPNAYLALSIFVPYSIRVESDLVKTLLSLKKIYDAKYIDDNYRIKREKEDVNLFFKKIKAIKTSTKNVNHQRPNHSNATTYKYIRYENEKELKRFFDDPCLSDYADCKEIFFLPSGVSKLVASESTKKLEVPPPAPLYYKITIQIEDEEGVYLEPSSFKINGVGEKYIGQSKAVLPALFKHKELEIVVGKEGYHGYTDSKKVEAYHKEARDGIYYVRLIKIKSKTPITTNSIKVQKNKVTSTAKLFPIKFYLKEDGEIEKPIIIKDTDTIKINGVDVQNQFKYGSFIKISKDRIPKNDQIHLVIEIPGYKPHDEYHSIKKIIKPQYKEVVEKDIILKKKEASALMPPSNEGLMNEEQVSFFDKMRKYWWILLVGLLVLAAVVGGQWGYAQYQEKQLENTVIYEKEELQKFLNEKIAEVNQNKKSFRDSLQKIKNNLLPRLGASQPLKPNFEEEINELEQNLDRIEFIDSTINKILKLTDTDKIQEIKNEIKNNIELNSKNSLSKVEDLQNRLDSIKGKIEEIKNQEEKAKKNRDKLRIEQEKIKSIANHKEPINTQLYENILTELSSVGFKKTEIDHLESRLRAMIKVARIDFIFKNNDQFSPPYQQASNNLRELERSKKNLNLTNQQKDFLSRLYKEKVKKSN